MELMGVRDRTMGITDRSIQHDAEVSLEHPNLHPYRSNSERLNNLAKVTKQTSS